MDKTIPPYVTPKRSIALEYLELCKPKVVLLMLLTSLVGMWLASNKSIPLHILFWGNLGIGLAACGAAAINHWVDRHIDSVMGRTLQRPLPTGTVKPYQALIFAISLSFIAMLILITQINTLTAVLTFFSLAGYAIVYTLFLKRATSQNIVIGGITGAAPPLLGWVAVTGQLDPNAWLLVLIIFIWTPPHFWALAIARHKEYAKADIPMLPVTHGIPYTSLHITLYSILLLAISTLPFVFGLSGYVYLITSILLGIWFISGAVRLQICIKHDKPHTQRTKLAMKLFKISIIYLSILFIVMAIDHAILVY